jgi:hypothetical protein
VYTIIIKMVLGAYPTCTVDLACVRDPAFIRTIGLDPQLVLETQFLLEAIQYS